MPLLSPEPFVFPDDLLTRPATAGDTGVSWWVLHTRPRSEKAIARTLLHAQTAFFLPVYQRQWRKRGRMFSSYLPLFPGYVFLYGDSQARLRALETNLVANCLTVGDQRQLHTDLARVYSLIASGAPLSPEARMQPGALVEIVSGPFAGFEGKVLQRGKRLKLTVEVQFLQQGVSVEIESWMLQPRGKPQPPVTEQNSPA
jgi:transcriptional antiterminator RfaH